MIVEAAELVSEMGRTTGLQPRCGVDGTRVTTFAIGGPLERLVEPRDLDQLQRLIKFLASHGQSYRILGAGSNLLISDSGVLDWVIRLGAGFRYINQIEAECFKVGASMSLLALSRELSDAGLSGLEFAGGIPASVGGAVKMNAGAHAGEFAQIIRNVTVVNDLGEAVVLSPSDLEFSYRHSSLPPNSIVTEVELKLVTSDVVSTKVRRSQCLQERKARQPLTMPSAGSVFKNPSKEVSAGYLIERAGLKGAKSGGALISELHANWIVNPERLAKAEDVNSLIKRCQSEVQNQAGVELKPEIVFW